MVRRYDPNDPNNPMNMPRGTTGGTVKGTSMAARPQAPQPGANRGEPPPPTGGLLNQSSGQEQQTYLPNTDAVGTMAEPGAAAGPLPTGDEEAAEQQLDIESDPASREAEDFTDQVGTGLARLQSEVDAERERRVRSAVESFLGKLQVQADEQVGKKLMIEMRWQEDLRNYHRRYDPDTEARLKQAKKSRLFVGMSKSKTHAWEARLGDLLFPTDDKNWGITATPVPTLTDKARTAAKNAAAAVGQANEHQDASAQHAAAGDPQAAMAARQAAVEMATKAQAHADDHMTVLHELDEARKRAQAMEARIEDQLVECRYNVSCRELLHDAVKLGTGILKGPVAASSGKRQWTKGDNGEWTLSPDGDERPEFVRVDPWSFFPDMNATTIRGCDFTFERHLYGKRDLRDLARRPGFLPDAIRQLLQEGPRDGLPPYMAVLREITQNTQASFDDKFVVWEYHGPIETTDAEAIAQAMQDPMLAREVALDPLSDYRAIIWFCHGHLLKFGVYPLDSGETMYSTFNFERDDTSIFGFGVPYLMRDSQAALNGAWRMMMDNGGLSVGPQIIVNRKVIEPADGVWEIRGNKLWFMTSEAVATDKAFTMAKIDNAQEQLAQIITLARQFSDDETNMPLIASGEQGTHVTTTAQGMSILMNSANVVFRRVVQAFDDEITTPSIRRVYDWNMQHATDDEIKGDYSVHARGSSVLLVREAMAQNLMAVVNQLLPNPIIGPMLKARNLIRKLFASYMLDANEMVKSDDELDAMEQAASQNKPPDPLTAKIQLEQAINEMKTKSELQLATFDRETKLELLAGQMNMSLDALKARLADSQAGRDLQERLTAADIGLKQQLGSGVAPTAAPATAKVNGDEVHAP